VKNTKRERAKSRVVEEIKAVLEVKNKIVVMSSYILTSGCCGRDNGGINFKHRARNVPPQSPVLAACAENQTSKPAEF